MLRTLRYDDPLERGLLLTATLRVMREDLKSGKVEPDERFNAQLKVIELEASLCVRMAHFFHSPMKAKEHKQAIDKRVQVVLNNQIETLSARQALREAGLPIKSANENGDNHTPV